jgi:ABC-2 type transport system ATP-binding protein
LLIMNVDESLGKWMHASPLLHPFGRSAVLRGMSKLQTPAIQALDLRKRYRDGTEVLRGVSFAVEPGTIFGYLGRNGAGKSTTVRILSTLTLPSGGCARVEGIDVQADPGGVRSRIGVAMQDAALDDYATARQHLELSARLWGLGRRVARQRVDELLEQFGLASAADARLARLSGGTRRRVDIATALITRPRVLFLDEPTTGLDPQSRRALWRELRALRDAGAAILLTTQYMDEASELADVVAVLDDGRLAALDAPERLVARASREVVELRLADPAQRDRVNLAAGAALAVAGDGNGTVRFELPAGTEGDGAVALMARIEDLAIPVGSIRIEQPSLEDAFLRLTGTAIDEAKAA